MVPADRSAARAGGVFRAFPTPGISGFTAPFEMDVVEAVRPARLVLRWRGEELHSDVVWELSAEGAGCLLRVSQAGFLGIAGEARRAELRQAYELMFEQRLPALLEWLDEVQPAPPVSVPVGPPVYVADAEPEPFEDRPRGTACCAASAACRGTAACACSPSGVRWCSPCWPSPR
ncbi:SRPBCC domain-containing protein [Catellatospora bangladeshensis]|uniref:SRPBCC family protein n=1 Tax=Catellatospora bangladeshensis TaxID=310355 RepID=UPI00360E31FB